MHGPPAWAGLRDGVRGAGQPAGKAVSHCSAVQLVGRVLGTLEGQGEAMSQVPFADDNDGHDQHAVGPHFALSVTLGVHLFNPHDSWSR